MRPIASLIVATFIVSISSALLVSACSYELPRADATLEGGSGGSGSSSTSSSSNGGFGGAISSSSSSSAESSASSSAESSSSSGEGSSSSSGNPMGICGDGIVEAPEECDDGNTNSGDNCSASCTYENHDRCDAPILELGMGNIVINGSTVGAGDSVTTTGDVEWCLKGTWSGPDLVYPIKSLVNGKLSALLTATYPNHMLHIRTNCPGTVADEVGCDNGATTGESDIATYLITAGQTVYVIVDGFNDSSGTFNLVLTIGP